MKKAAVVGAAGKMGRGISLLLLEDFLKRKEAGEEVEGLVLMDASQEGLEGLRGYLAGQLEKKGLSTDGLNLVRLTTRLEEVKGANAVFEAIVEDLPTKVRLFKTIQALNGAQPYFFSNTSSIPIAELDREAQLHHRIIGFHFYNPPAVQKLVEVITNKDTDARLKTMALDFGKRLGKVMVPSHDVAGFIGNGQFMRDILFACTLVAELEKEVGWDRALLMVNRVTQDFLIRPMGIFQLLDYVGWDVCGRIIEVMSRYIPDEDFHHPVLGRLLESGITGGQYPDGSQKEGLFRYEKGRPIGLYSLEKKRVLPLEAVPIDLGDLPEGHEGWKSLVRDPQREDKLLKYFQNLKQSQALGARLASRYLTEMKRVGQALVDSGVAASAADVNTVMTHGFFHLYGPINTYG